METDIVFLFIGGAHQVAHLAPVAAEVSRRRPALRIRCLSIDADTDAALQDVRQRMAAPEMLVTRLAAPRGMRFVARTIGRESAVKGPMLAAIRWLARDARMIVVPERTSAALRWMGWRRPLIHFRHGAGDRAPRSEKRLRAFDRIVVAGDKDVARALGQGIVPERLRAVGYVKLDYLARGDTEPCSLFADDRPIIFYNPHFDATRSSLPIARDVIARFRAQDRYNLIYAPHVRASENLTPGERASLMAMAEPGRVVVDLGSPRLFDMSYARAADAYLGDMSSQLYEFLARPRPVAFIDAHGVDWRGDPRYAGWHLGEVASGSEDVIGAIDRAFGNHSLMAARQADAVAQAFGDYRGAIGRAASVIIEEAGV